MEGRKTAKGGYLMGNKLTVNDIPITLRRGTYNIINCGIRTGKTFGPLTVLNPIPAMEI